MWNFHFVLDTFICNQNTRFLPWINFLAMSVYCRSYGSKFKEGITLKSKSLHIYPSSEKTGYKCKNSTTILAHPSKSCSCRTYCHEYSYNKSQQDALFLNFILIKSFLNFILIKSSTCFGRTYCPSSGVCKNISWCTVLWMPNAMSMCTLIISLGIL